MSDVGLTPLARQLLAGSNFAIVGTTGKDGAPQQSVVWVCERRGEILFSTVAGRAKHRNLVRDPRVGVLIIDGEDGYRYSHIRGIARIEPDPGGNLIKELSLRYTGNPWHEDAPAGRVIVSVIPERFTEHGGS